MLRIVYCLCLLLVVVDSRIVQTSYGRLEGREVNYNGKLLHMFKRVPFTTPPIGDLRFALPEPPAKWGGVLNATEYGPACMLDSVGSGYKPEWISEDCLHLNIFTSDYCLRTKSCPTVVYIHGGDYNYDSAVMFNDTALLNNFASKDVVLVIPAFRLGFFGLYSAQNTNVVPENLAVYDNWMSLKYVNSEIKNFGGNPDDVTLMGHSMGGSAVLMIMASPVIDPDIKLFHRCIVMSGIVVFADKVNQQTLTREFVEHADCNRTVNNIPDEKAELDCLRSKDAKFLLQIQRKMEENGKKMGDVTMSAPLFPADSLQDFIHKLKSRPLLIGSTSKELDMDKGTDDYFIPELASLLGYNNLVEIREKYTSDRLGGKLDFDHSVQTQLFFLTSELAAGIVSPSYLFSYKNPLHPMHADYIYYFMGVHQFDFDENEAILADIFPNLFINFIKTGKPNGEWKIFDKKLDNFYYIDVNVNSGLRPHNALDYEKETLKYWKEDMKVFDNLITEQKLRTISQQPRNIEVPNKELTESEQYLILYSNYWIVIILVGCFVLGCIFGVQFMGSSESPPQYELVAPNEKTYLMQQVF